MLIAMGALDEADPARQRFHGADHGASAAALGRSRAAEVAERRGTSAYLATRQRVVLGAAWLSHRSLMPGLELVCA